MEEIKIINEVMPVIEMNIESFKASLEETLKKYSNIVVTEETLSGCKATQKELAGFRRKIDTYRVEKKQALSVPIVVFENQCKELVQLIEKAEEPIKQGIKVFDDMTRDKNRLSSIVMIKEAIEEQGLNEKYAKQLTVLEKYCQLSVTKKEVKTDLTQRAFALRVEQNREEELLDIIRDTVHIQNKRIQSKMDFADFEVMVERGMATKDIIAEVTSRADAIYKAENPPPPPTPIETTIDEEEEPVSFPTPFIAMQREPIYEPVVMSTPVISFKTEEEDQIRWKETWEITGTKSQLEDAYAIIDELGLKFLILKEEVAK